MLSKTIEITDGTFSVQMTREVVNVSKKRLFGLLSPITKKQVVYTFIVQTPERYIENLKLTGNPDLPVKVNKNIWPYGVVVSLGENQLHFNISDYWSNRYHMREALFECFISVMCEDASNRGFKNDHI